MTPLLGFTPDAESPTPGVIVDCDQFIPYESGMEAAPSLKTPTNVPVLPAACLGAGVMSQVNGTRRVFAGTVDKLYELGSGTWTDVSAATYGGGSDTRWSFAQFGDATLAANKADIIQRSTSGAFAAISGAPKAEVIYAVGSFIMALNVNDGADKQDGWHCCASFDDTDWTEDVATQSNSGRLVATSGALTAGARLGEFATAYKEKSLYLGQYVGAPAVWDWVQVPGDAGCVGKEALCDVGGSHFFVSADNFWMFDGTRPVPVGDQQLRQWFVDNSNPSYLYKTKAIFDRQQNRVWVFYPSTGATTCDAGLVYHLRTKQWGRANQSIEAVLNYIGVGLTFDTWNGVGSTFDTLPDIPFDSPYWLSGSTALAVFNTSHQLQTLTGTPGNSSFTTGDAGDDDTVTTLRGVKLRFAAGRGPDTASITTQRKMNSGDSYSAGSTISSANGKFDVMQAARWHTATISMTGSARVTGIRADFDASGDR